MVLVMAISALGHVALRVVGNRRGLAIAGFFAGYVSSTAAVAGFGQRVREAPALLRPAVGAAILANLASLSLFVPILLAVSPGLLEQLWPELAAVAVVLAAGGLLGLRGNGADSVPPPTADTKMFQFRHSLVFAAVIAAVLFLSAALNAWVGPRGAMAVAVVAALGELHAAVATVGNLYKTGVLSADEARLGLIGLLVASGLAKTAVAWVSGGGGYALRVGAGLGASVLAAAAVRGAAVTPGDRSMRQGLLLLLVLAGCSPAPGATAAGPGRAATAKPAPVQDAAEAAGLVAPTPVEATGPVPARLTGRITYPSEELPGDARVRGGQHRPGHRGLLPHGAGPGHVHAGRAGRRLVAAGLAAGHRHRRRPGPAQRGQRLPGQRRQRLRRPRAAVR